MTELLREKLSLLTELIKLASCDKAMREGEYYFLLAVAQQLEVEKKDFDQLFEEYIEFTPPKMEFERILQFHRLVLLMNADQEITDEELVLIKSMGIRMGLNPLAVETVLEIMYKFENNVVPPKVLLEIFTTQHN